MFRVEQLTSRTISWWHNRRATIDMNPPYQRRGGVWTNTDKAFLIDSIINEYDIPKIYVADFSYVKSPLNLRSLQYAVIDGRQRLEAMFDFIEGRVRLDRKFKFEANPEIELTGLSYQDLTVRFPDIAERFMNYNLMVMGVVTDEEEKINSLFVRLNRNKPLTGAELRNAMAGTVPELIRTLVVHDFFLARVRFKMNRGEDKNVAAKLLLIEFRGRFVDTKRTHLDRFVEEATKTDALVSEFDRAAKRVQESLNALSNIFTPSDPLLGSQGSIPLYYWMVRNYNGLHHRFIRSFLVGFERERREVRKRIKPGDTVSPIDSEYLAFNTLDRSTNDQGSLEGRYEILDKRFRAYFEREVVEFVIREGEAWQDSGAIRITPSEFDEIVTAIPPHRWLPSIVSYLSVLAATFGSHLEVVLADGKPDRQTIASLVSLIGRTPSIEVVWRAIAMLEQCNRERVVEALVGNIVWEEAPTTTKELLERLRSGQGVQPYLRRLATDESDPLAEQAAAVVRQIVSAFGRSEETSS